jgi:hypothetical protein
MRSGSISLVLVAISLAGCSQESSDAERVTRGFLQALKDDDGRRACAALTNSTRETLEREEAAQCHEAIGSLAVEPNGTITESEAYGAQARVRLSTGEFAFLGRTPAGWRIDAAGCTPAAEDEPYDCELES